MEQSFWFLGGGLIMETTIVRNRGFHTSYNRDTLRRIRNQKRKRIQEIKRKMLFAALTVAFIILLGTVFGSFLSDAKTVDHKSEFKYFTRYTVRSEETLWEISSEYVDEHYDGIPEYLAEVKAMNHIEDINAIQAGTILLLPYYSDVYLY